MGGGGRAGEARLWEKGGRGTMRKGDMVAVMYAIGPDRRGTTDRSAVLLRGGDAGTDPRGCSRHGGDARGSHGVQSRNPGGGAAVSGIIRCLVCYGARSLSRCAP